MFLLSFDGSMNGKSSFVEEMEFASPEAAMQYLIDGGFGGSTPSLHDDQTGENYDLTANGNKPAFVPSGKDIFLVPMEDRRQRRQSLVARRRRLGRRKRRPVPCGPERPLHAGDRRRDGQGRAHRRDRRDGRRGMGARLSAWWREGLDLVRSRHRQDHPVRSGNDGHLLLVRRRLLLRGGGAQGRP